jgi:hypothetical protein
MSTYWINTIRPIRSCNNCYTFQFFNTIHFDQKCSNNTITDIRLTVKNNLNILFSFDRCKTYEFDELDRELAIASISSKNIIAGDARRARRNNSRIARSDSPTHLLNNSGPYANFNSIVKEKNYNQNKQTLTAIKLRLDSVAIAFAIIVFEQPGGPYIKIPFGT